MKIDLVAVDSSVLVSLFASKESHYLHSKKLINWIIKNNVKIIMPMLVLYEVFHTLRRIGWFDEKNSYAKFSKIMNSENFAYIAVDTEFFNGFKQIDFFNKLKTSDAIIAASAFFNETVLISWDKKMIKNCYHGCTPIEFLKSFSG